MIGINRSQNQDENMQNGELSIAKNEIIQTQINYDEYFENIKNNLTVKQQGMLEECSRKLDPNNRETIVLYGDEASTHLNAFADKTLQILGSTENVNSVTMMQNLQSIMKKFDREEIDPNNNEAKGLFGRMKKMAPEKIQKLIQELLKKYNNVSQDIEKIYVELKKYQNGIVTHNRGLVEMQEQLRVQYENLMVYIAAGGKTLQEWKAYKEELIDRINNEPDNYELQMEMQELDAVIESLDRKIYSLESVAMATRITLPQMIVIEKNNQRLYEQIRDSFVTTLPIFKSSIINAITLKQQRMITDSMDALKETTNEMLIRNAQGVMDTSRDIARLSSQPMIEMQTISKCVDIIVQGIADVKQIEEKSRQDREKNRIEMEKIIQNFKNMKTLK